MHLLGKKIHLGAALGALAIVGASLSPVANGMIGTNSSGPEAATAQTCTSTFYPGGTVQWGIKESWRDYITNKAHGAQAELTDGAGVLGGNITGAGSRYNFPVVPSKSKVAADGSYSLGTKGKIHYTAYNGVLDITISDVRVVRAADGTTTVTADVTHKDQATQQMETLEDAVLATVSGDTAPTAAKGEGEIIYEERGTTLAEATGKIFAEQYPGAQGDPITVDELEYNLRCTEPETSPEAEPKPEASPAEPKPAQPQNPADTSTPKANETCSTDATSGSLEWTLPPSLRSGHTISVSDPHQSDKAAYDAATGALSLPEDHESAVFRADGTSSLPSASKLLVKGDNLDLQLRRFDVHVNADHSGFLNTKISEPGGEETEIRLADLTDISARPDVPAGESATWSITAKAVLAPEAEPYFKGALKAGQALDDVNVRLVMETTCKDNTPKVKEPEAQGDPKAQPDPVPAPKPAPEPGTCRPDLTTGMFHWGLNGTYRSYILGRSTRGAWKLTEGAGSTGVPNDETNFTYDLPVNLEKSVVNLDGSMTLYLRGVIDFSGHGGILDMGFSNFVYHRNADGSGYLTSSYRYRDLGSNENRTGEDKVFVRTSESSNADHSPQLILTEGAQTWSPSHIESRLDAQTVPVFAGYYNEGLRLDDISIDLGYTVTCTPPEQPKAEDNKAEQPEQPKGNADNAADNAAKPEQPKAEDNKPEQPEQPKAEDNKPEQPEQPKANADNAAKPEQPKGNADNAAKPEQPKAEDNKPEQPKADPKAEQPEQPKGNADNAAKPEQPKADPKAEQPAQPDQPKAEQPEQPKAEQPEQPKAEDNKAEQPKADPKAEQPEQPKGNADNAAKPEQPKAEDNKAEQPKAEDNKPEQPEQPKADMKDLAGSPAQPSAEPTKAPATSGAKLARTGVEAGLLLLVAVGLVSLGVIARRRA